MPKAEIVGDRIELEIDPHRDKLLVRSVPGRKYDLNKRVWWIPISWSSCIALRGVFGESLVVGPKLGAWAQTEVEQRVRPAMALREQLDLEDDDEPVLKGLYPFQKSGAAFLNVAKQALLADEMGTGKTIQAIAALKLADAAPILIVCPNSVKRNWLRELSKWWPEVGVEVYTPGKAGKEALERVKTGLSRVLIINWENTWRLSKLAPFGSIKLTDKDKEPKPLNEIPFEAVVADEAHRAKEPSAKQTRALWAVMHKAKYRFALTGTPVANSPRDLWSIMHGLAPHEYPGYGQFVDRYGMQSWNAFGGLEVVGLNPTTKDEFFKFFDPRFLRRSKALVLPELPAKTYSQRFVTLSGKQKKAYTELEDRMLTELDNGDVAYVTTPLAKLTRLRQVAASYVDIDDDKWMLTEPSAKLDELDAILEEAGDEQIVVFAEHRQIIDLYAARLDKRGISYGQLTGAQSEQLRQDDIESFKAGKLKIMLCTLGAGGEGVDGLQVASIVVFLQRSYSMIKDKQAEDRLHRSGQQRPVEVIDIVAEETIEDRILQVLEQKGERLEEICRDKDTLRRLISG